MTIEILTAALVLITGFYAWATYKILRANERVVEVMHEQAEAMTRPYIAVTTFLEVDNPIFYLRITNTGKTSAINLKLSMDKPFYRLADKSAFNEIIQSFPPGAELVFMLAQSFVIFADNADSKKMPTCFTVTAEYSFGGKLVTESNIIDLKPYTGSNIPQDAYVRKLTAINESIQMVAKKIEKES
jgi:hypothetical protein